MGVNNLNSKYVFTSTYSIKFILKEKRISSLGVLKDFLQFNY